MEAEDVASLYGALEEDGVDTWLLGGWGIDALLGRQTRSHHDLDLVVEVKGLERMRLRLAELGFSFAYVWWEEVLWIRDDAWQSPLEEPSAFVYQHEDGREVDVHTLRVGADGAIEMLWRAPYAFTAEGLSGVGTIAGRRVRCLTADLQRRAHTGYELPPHHVRDVELLDELP